MCPAPAADAVAPRPLPSPPCSYGAIVTRLQSIEEMAGMNMLCSDKTGEQGGARRAGPWGDGAEGAGLALSSLFVGR